MQSLEAIVDVLQGVLQGVPPEVLGAALLLGPPQGAGLVGNALQQCLEAQDPVAVVLTQRPVGVEAVQGRQISDEVRLLVQVLPER